MVDPANVANSVRESVGSWLEEMGQGSVSWEVQILQDSELGAYAWPEGASNDLFCGKERMAYWCLGGLAFGEEGGV